MRSVSNRSNWSGGANTPELSQNQWNLLAIPAAVLAVMAVLQIISFGRFKDWLDSIGVGWTAVVAVVLIIAELWGAVSLLRVPMSSMLRFLGLSLGVLAVGFWFIENLYVVSNGIADRIAGSDYFGRYLSQTAGWWTVIEVAIMLYLLVWAAEIIKWRPANRA